MEFKENKIIKAESMRDYYLNLPHLIVGSLTAYQKAVKVYEDSKIIEKEIEYSQTLSKMIDELTQNSIDENVRTNGVYANKLIVKIDQEQGYITVSDNGRGIPVDTALMATTEFHTSSNFDFITHNNTSDLIGAHGIGSKLVPLFSSDFQLTTVTLEGDRCIVKCTDNMGNITHKIDKAPTSVTNGVTVRFKPDFERLKINNISDDMVNHIHALLINIAYNKPQIEIIFQGKQIKIKDFKDFIKYYSDNYSILQDDEQLSLAVFPSDDYRYIHIVNSLDLNKGGVALDYIVNNVVNAFTNRLKKGYSKITNTSVKQKLGVILVFRDMKALRFGGGQTKEEIKNTVTELGIPTLKYDNFAEILFKNNAIKTPIMEVYRVQQELEARKANTLVRKEKKEAFNPKFIKPTEENKYLFIAEGDSAISSLPDALGRKDKGYLPLTGKLQNALKSTVASLTKNQRVIDIIEAFGIGLEKTKFENCVIASDADLDGNHICALIIALFYKLQPDVLTEGRMFRLRTPVIAITQNDKLIKWYYTLQEYQADEANLPKNVTISYLKGLGSLTAKNFKIIFETDGQEKYLEKIEFNPGDEAIIEQWMTDQGVDFRKEVLGKNSFDINNL